MQAPPAGAEADGVLRLLEPGVEDFAGRLLDPARERPVIVVSIPGDRDRPWIDVDEVESAVRGLADVVLLADDAASWALTPLLPEKTQVYGGAGRVYPVGTDWRADPTVAPLRFAYDENGGARAAARLTQDALVMAARTLSVRLAPAEARNVHGEVRGLVETSRAVVRLDGDGYATIWSDLTVPGVPIDRLVRPGQRVHGTLVGATRRLDITSMLNPASGADYPAGAVVLASVTAVRPDMVHLALTPDHVVPVPKDRVTSNPLDRMTSLFTVGETVLARVAWLDGDKPFLRLDDIDDDEVPLPAHALVEGGPPWLSPPPPEALDEPDDGGGTDGAQSGTRGVREATTDFSEAPGSAGPSFEPDVFADDGAVPVPADPIRGAAVPTPRDVAGGPAPRDPAGSPAPRDVAGSPAPRDVVAGPAPQDVAGGPTPREVVAGPTPSDPAGSPVTRDLAGAPAARGPATGSTVRNDAVRPTPLVHAAGHRAALLAAEHAEMRARMMELEQLNARLEDTIRRTKTELRKEKSRSARSAASGGRSAAGVPAFLDPVEQFMHEVYLSWVEVIAAGQKAELPLCKFSLGPDFLQSLDANQGVDREKVVRVAVEVLTGLANNLDSRGTHVLRTGESGGSPAVTREGGWTCWRVAVQRETPAARRLHYWRRGAEVELSRVVNHDDYRP